MPPFSREAVLLAKVIALAALAALVLYLVVSGVLTSGKRRVAEARLATASAQAQAGAGVDAVGIADAARTEAQTSADLTLETADAIRKAPGADVRLDPDLNRAARERLCQRPAYRSAPDCLQFADRPQPAH